MKRICEVCHKAIKEFGTTFQIGYWGAKMCWECYRRMILKEDSHV